MSCNLDVSSIELSLDKFRIFVKQLNDTVKCRIESTIRDITNTPLIELPEQDPMEIHE